MMNLNKHCKYIVDTLSFHQHNVRLCTTLQMGPVLSTYTEKSPKELAEKIFNIRKQIHEGNENGIIPPDCKNCIYTNDEYTDTYQIRMLDFYYWYHCNCSCIYCSYRDETKGKYSDFSKCGNPLIYKTIKELYKMKQISNKGLVVRFGGGEFSVLKEFPKLINLFLKYGINTVMCESSGIKYSKSVATLLKQGKSCITIAVCAGTPEIYKKIKRRDKYKQVMKNLQKYVKDASKCKKRISTEPPVTSKYIIIEGINNNYEEVEKWLQESKKYGLEYVEISMEFCWGIQTKAGKPVEQYNYDIFDYVEKRCKELGLNLRKNATSLAIMEKGFY